MNEPHVPRDSVAVPETADPSIAKLPSRKSEIARLKLSQLSLESGLTLESFFREICVVASEYLGTARVGIWLLNENRQLLRCVQMFEQPGEHSQGAILHLNDYPNYFEALKNRKIVSAEMAQHDPLTSELLESYLKPLGITSILDAPVYAAGEVIGVLCSEHVGTAREWSTEERDFLSSMSDMVGLKIRVAEVHQLRALLELSTDRIMTMEKSEALAKMAYEVAHDFRNILSVIVNCAETLGSGLTDPLKTKDLILAATRRGTSLVKELTDYGRNSPTNPSVLKIGDALKESLVLLQSAVGAQYQIDLQLESSLGKVLMDKNELQRILINLILNAKHAMQDGGTIDLKAKRWKSKTASPTDEIAIEVRDHGCGMSEETKKRLFEPFFTTKPDGSGLGMPIVRRIVDRVGGDIQVESQLHQGTTIRVLLPLVAH